MDQIVTGYLLIPTEGRLSEVVRTRMHMSVTPDWLMTAKITVGGLKKARDAEHLGQF